MVYIVHDVRYGRVHAFKESVIKQCMFPLSPGPPVAPMVYGEDIYRRREVFRRNKNVPGIDETILT